MDTFGVPIPTSDEIRRLRDDALSTAKLGSTTLFAVTKAQQQQQQQDQAAKPIVAAAEKIIAAAARIKKIVPALYAFGYIHVVTLVIVIFLGVYAWVSTGGPSAALGNLTLLFPVVLVVAVQMQANVTFNVYSSPVFRATRLGIDICAVLFSALYLASQIVFVASWCNDSVTYPVDVPIGYACVNNYAVIVCATVGAAWYFVVSLVLMALDFAHYDRDRDYIAACTEYCQVYGFSTFRYTVLRLNFEEFPSSRDPVELANGLDSLSINMTAKDLPRAPRHSYMSGYPVFKYYIPMV